MSKSILIIDTPDCCDNCPALNRKNHTGENYTCGGTWAHILKGFKRYEEKRGPNCPLKHMPQKRILPKEMVDGTNYGEEPWFSDGYNACIDEILGDTE